MNIINPQQQDTAENRSGVATNINENKTETSIIKPLVRKLRIAEILTCSPRQVDNYMAQGMPHHKPSSRKVTFDTEEVLMWYKKQFGVQRRKSLALN